MPERTKHDFSNRTLSLAERFQEKAGHSFIGRAAVRAVAGSSSKNYVQLDWFSAGVRKESGNLVIADGDPAAGKLPRFWQLAFILGSDGDALSDLHSHVGKLRAHEAVAYVTEGNTWHVGIHPKQRHLFRENDNGEGIIAMRHGKTRVVASMGLWLPDERVYLGSYGVKVLQQGVLQDELANLSTQPILT